MNQSFQSPHPDVGTVSLLYNSATEQLTVFVQNFKLFDMSTCQDFFTNMSTQGQKLDEKPIRVKIRAKFHLRESRWIHVQNSP